MSVIATIMHLRRILGPVGVRTSRRSDQWVQGKAGSLPLIPAFPLSMLPVAMFPMFVIFAILPMFRSWILMGAAVIFAIPGHIHIMVPVVMDEIDRSATGVVLVAIPVPSFDMARGHAKIDGGIADI